MALVFTPKLPVRPLTVTVRVAPEPDTPMASVPVTPEPFRTAKFWKATPNTGSLNVTVNTGGSLVGELFTLETDTRVGAVVSMMNALAVPSDPAAPGAPRVSTAGLPAASLIDPLFSCSAVAER